MSLVLPPHLAAIQQHIVDHCATGPGTYVIPYPLRPGTRLFVKRGNQSLAGEARTQAYLREQARSNRIAPNVPTVYGTFNDGACNTYLVMEHIDALSFRAWVDAPCISDEEHEHRTTTAVTAIAKALSWLLTCPIPEGDTIGPVGGGCIQHSFFDMEEAPVPLVSAAALEKYVNKALTRRPGRPQDTVSFADEACIFSHSDVSLDNFLWDPATQRVWLTDCQHINVLPESFCSFYLHTSTDPIVQAVSAALNFPTSSQLGLLKSANGIVIQSGTSSFGLDAYGNPSLGRK